MGEALLAGVLALAASPALAVAPAAGDSQALLAEAERGSLVVVGLLAAPRALDRSGRVAELQIERVLVGELAVGAKSRIAWEELAPSRPDRFRADQRVLAVLAPLPGTSLWRRRLPEGGAWQLAADGRAFLQSPDAETLAALTRWLALGPVERDEAAGVTALAGLVARGEAGLAAAAVARLGRIAALPERLEQAVPALAGAIADPQVALEVRRDLCGLAESRRLVALRPALARVAEDSGDPARPEALTALAALDGGLPKAKAMALLESASPGVRAAAVRGGAIPGERIAGLLVHDPAPEVRGAALEVLLEREGERAFPSARGALFDRDAKVRETAIRGIGALGAAVVPDLEALAARERDPHEARALLATLAMAGPDGRSALGRIASHHEAERVRALARLFLGVEPYPGH